MNTTTETLHAEIYPALFELLPDALPEFDFIKTGNGYKSTNVLKVSGQEGDSRGKVYVYDGAPGYLKDYRGGSLSIWDYVQQRDALTTNNEVFRRLAELACVTLPEQQLDPKALERITRARRLSDMWEAANDFFIDCLGGSANEYANGKTATRVREYLTNPIDKGGRGYSPGLFRMVGQQHNQEAPKMELGYIPGIIELQVQLESKGFSNAEVLALLATIQKSGTSVGTQNILTFPYRDHIGRIRGMAFRAIDKNAERKYLYSSFSRSEVLFNLKAVSKDRDLVIVESPLDALHAAALGIKNITALGGSGDTLNKTQIDLAVKFGATKITLMLDNDSVNGIDGAGAKGTDKAVAFLQKEYLKLKVYVGQYPEGIKDLDELLVTQGEEGFYKVKDSALSAWRYQLYRLLTYYVGVGSKNESGALEDKQIDDLRDEVIHLAAKLNPLDAESLLKEYAENPGLRT